MAATTDAATTTRPDGEDGDDFRFDREELRWSEDEEDRRALGRSNADDDDDDGKLREERSRAEEQGSRKAGRSGVDLRSVISRRDEIEEKIERCLQGKLDSFLSRVEKMVEDKGEGQMRERVEALQRNEQAVSQKQEVAELRFS